MAWRPEHDDTVPANTIGSVHRDAGWDSGWGSERDDTPPRAANSRHARSSRTLADMPTVQTPHAPRPTAPNSYPNPQQSDTRWDEQYEPQYPPADAPTRPGTRPAASSRTHAGMAGRSGASLPMPMPMPMPMSMSTSRALVQREAQRQGEDRSVLVPASATQGTVMAPALMLPNSRKHTGGWRWSRLTSFAVVVITLVVAVVVVLGVGAHLAPLQVSQNVPQPTGRGPWSAAAGNIVYIPPPPKTAPGAKGSNNSAPTGPGMASPLEPCKDSYKFVPNISQWTVPPGCYANIYVPNPANYVSRPGFGWCNWWVRVTHPNHPDITENTSYPRGSIPVPGAAIFFDGYEQGALSEGHWAQVVAVSSDHYWVLISEMNFAWRGGGFGKIDYRYIHVSPHVHFVYVYS
ncbi:MAG: hypothetical protein ABI068_10670 [Ktedonobacterales bacterium]